MSSTRTLIAAAGLAAAALASTAASMPVAAGAGDSADNSGTIVVEHALGVTELTGPPARIVTLSDRDFDSVLALGIVPVGTQSHYGYTAELTPWALPLVGDAEVDVWPGFALNFEAIAALEPDLIVNVVSDGDADVYAELSAIAPTLGPPVGAAPYAATSSEAIELVAAALGDPAAGAAAIAAYDETIAGYRAAHPEFADHSIVYFDIGDGALYTGGVAHPMHATLYTLGFQPAAVSAEAETPDAVIVLSAEHAGRLDADVLVTWAPGMSIDDLVAAVPLLAGLDAVANGRVIILDDFALAQSSVLSVPFGMEALLPELRGLFVAE